MIDTETLNGEFVMVYGDPGAQGIVCPVCHCAKLTYDCEGCGYEFPMT